MRLLIIKLRFSLRFLMLLTVVASIASYSLALPTLRVNRFVKAVDEGDVAAVDRMFDNGGIGTAYQLRNAEIRIEPLSWTQIAKGERHLSIYLPYGQQMGEMDWHLSVIATRWNLEVLFAIT